MIALPCEAGFASCRNGDIPPFLGLTRAVVTLYQMALRTSKSFASPGEGRGFEIRSSLSSRWQCAHQRLPTCRQTLAVDTWHRSAGGLEARRRVALTVGPMRTTLRRVVQGQALSIALFVEPTSYSTPDRNPTDSAVTDRHYRTKLALTRVTSHPASTAGQSHQ